MGGRGRKARQICFFQWSSLWTTTFDNLIKTIVVIHNTGLWQIIQKPSLWTTIIELKNWPKTIVHDDDQCQLAFNVTKHTTLIIFLKPKINFIFFYSK